jgi:hypothetical protein
MRRTRRFFDLQNLEEMRHKKNPQVLRFAESRRDETQEEPAGSSM